MRIRLESETGETRHEFDAPWSRPRDVVCWNQEFFVPLGGGDIGPVRYRPATCCILTEGMERLVVPAPPAFLRGGTGDDLRTRRPGLFQRGQR